MASLGVVVLEADGGFADISGDYLTRMVGINNVGGDVNLRDIVKASFGNGVGLQMDLSQCFEPLLFLPFGSHALERHPSYETLGNSASTESVSWETLCIDGLVPLSVSELDERAQREGSFVPIGEDGLKSGDGGCHGDKRGGGNTFGDGDRRQCESLDGVDGMRDFVMNHMPSICAPAKECLVDDVAA